VLKTCLTSRYPRESYVLTNKLSPNKFETEEDIRPLFEDQLKECGVEYFDFYLFHANSAARHERFKSTRAYDIAQELKAEGKIRHVGMSFHDSARVLDKILTERPEIEVVQLQLNYVDWDDMKVQSRKCYDVCKKHGKPVLVMEPVKGGTLVNLPEKAVKELNGISPAQLAIRFAASFPDVAMVLSGMSNMEQMVENVSFMKDFKPLTFAEEQIVGRVRTIYQAQNRIPCTGCRYCTDGCPAGLDIPALFACLNDKREGKEANYDAFDVKADACVECGQCEGECPQHLQIRDLLKEVAAAF
jgi:predicted aldo/keto reductase-like oxidoreductase